MEPLGVVVLIGTCAAVTGYVLINRRRHRRWRPSPRPEGETCWTGEPHLWVGQFTFPPPKGPVEEKCEVCGARRVVEYGDGHREPKVLSREPPKS